MIFTDKLGRDWNIIFNYQTLCKIEDDLGINILDDPTSLPKSGRKYVEVAWICIEDQAKQLGITPEDFGSAIDGPSFKKLMDVILIELAVFFEAPKPGVSALYRKSIELNDKVLGASKEAVESLLDDAFSELLERSGLTHAHSQPGN